MTISNGSSLRWLALPLICFFLACEEEPGQDTNPSDTTSDNSETAKPDYVQDLYSFFDWYKSQMPEWEKRGLTDTVGQVSGADGFSGYVTTANPDYTYLLQSSNHFTKHYIRALLDRQNSLMIAATHGEMPSGQELPPAPTLFAAHSSQSDCRLNSDSVPLLSYSAQGDTATVAVMLWDTAWFTMVKRDSLWQIEDYQPAGSSDPSDIDF